MYYIVLLPLLNLLLDGHGNAREQRGIPVQLGEQVAGQLSDGGGGASTPLPQRLLVCQIGLQPVQQVPRGLRVPHVHEAQGADEGGVRVRQEPVELLARQPQRVQLVEEAVRRGDDAACAHTSHLQPMLSDCDSRKNRE